MVLVTGGTGLVGSHLIFKLAQNEIQIRAIYRSEERIKKVKHIFSYYTNDIEALFSKIQWVKADITDITTLQPIFKNVTHVYHCAALVSFDPNDYPLLRHINIEGTTNIVNLCLSNAIQKLCYVSTIATIGTPIDETDFINEDTYWDPEEDHSVYAITKYGAEMEVWRASQEGLDVVIVNPGIILGPGFWKSGSGSLFTRIYKGLSYYTNGVTGYIDVKDVTYIMEKLMRSTIKNERFILVSENISFKDVFNSIASVLNVNAPKKRVSKTFLNVGWRLDWLHAFFRGKQRILTKQVAISLLQHSFYDNSKIKTALDTKLINIDTSIITNGGYFLKDFNN